jgi:predicted esterase
MVAGFSQGCGMAIHSLYTNPELVDAAIGISGYIIPYLVIFSQ